ncbi:MAG: hypothetical protein L6R39_006134, partial [Caloplaca ligustica]
GLGIEMRGGEEQEGEQHDKGKGKGKEPEEDYDDNDDENWGGESLSSLGGMEFAEQEKAEDEIVPAEEDSNKAKYKRKWMETVMRAGNAGGKLKFGN